MQGIATLLTDEEQARLGAIRPAGMPTDGTGLTAIVGVHFDGHTLMQEGFIGDHGVQFGKGPFAIGSISLALLLARTLALAPFGPVSNVSQVFMVGVLLQPSLSPSDHHQTAGGRTSAFFLKTLAEARVMIGLGHNGLPGMEGLFAPGASRYGQVAQTHVYPDDRCVRGARWRLYFHLQGDEHIKVFAGLIIPEFGRPDVRSVLNEGHVLVIACIGENDAPAERQDADTALCLEGIIMPKLIGQRRRNELGSLVQSLIPFPGDAYLALCRVLLQLGPQRLIDGADLPGDTSGHSGRDLEAGTELLVGPILQPNLVAHLAVRVSIAGDIVQPVTIGKLGRS
jgi:hypothetical protein